MLKVYLHLFNGIGAVRDDEGREVDDLEAAKAAAINDIRSILSEDVLAGVVDLQGRVEISDEAGARLAIVPFEDAVEVLRGPPA